MNSIDKLAELFEAFPGIGKRQSRRFVYFLLHKDLEYIESLKNEIASVKKEISQCPSCFRFFPKYEHAECMVCKNPDSKKQLLVVEKDADFDNLHKTRIYQGKYFILGGFIEANEKKRSFARVQQLLSRIEKDSALQNLDELIFGLSISPQAEHTRIRLTHMIQERFPHITISTLGRGLSSGTELEYSDTETLKYALNSRIQQ